MYLKSDLKELKEIKPCSLTSYYENTLIEGEDVIFEYEGENSVLVFTNKKIITVEIFGSDRETSFIPYNKFVGVKYSSNANLSEDVLIEIYGREPILKLEFMDNQRSLSELVRFLAEKIV